MKITMSAITIACLILLVGTMSNAADAVVSKEVSAENQQVVDLSKVRRHQKLRAWVDSIKPAAGHVETKANPAATEYWRQSVRRENRGTMRE
ncbi:MAG: hypothetical protein KKD63_02560 [Proteobacteria bacterium]|nr:hypothetical protein [Desulfobulbaceae bacterium]MBU4151743.1 hypothetical protein [Pseudomonadota bacterium]MDP2106968.1 hypothetical protein [Desulfobulbaceae bacterium]